MVSIASRHPRFAWAEVSLALEEQELADSARLRLAMGPSGAGSRRDR